MKILRFGNMKADHADFRITYGYNLYFINLNFKFPFAKYKTDTSLKFISSSFKSEFKACRHKGTVLEEPPEGFKNYSLKLRTREIVLIEMKTARHAKPQSKGALGPVSILIKTSQSWAW